MYQRVGFSVFCSGDMGILPTSLHSWDPAIVKVHNLSLFIHLLSAVDIVLVIVSRSFYGQETRNPTERLQKASAAWHMLGYAILGAANFKIYAKKTQECALCGKDQPAFRCSKCKAVSYCSKQHQYATALDHKHSPFILILDDQN